MHRSISLYSLLFLILTATSGSLIAQPTNAGREFYFSFPPNWSSPSPDMYIRLYIISKAATTVRVFGGDVLIKQTITIPNEIVAVDIPLNMGEVYSRVDRDPIPNDKVYPNKAIRVESADPVVIYGINRVTYTTDGILALPTSGLGREYIIASAPDITDHNVQKFPSQYTVTATQDNTLLTIVNSWDTYGSVAGQPVTVTMNKGDVYSVAAKGTLSDLTGSVVTSNRPVAVLAGQFCVYLPDRRYGYCDYLVEMMLPVSAWGKVYHLVPFQNRLKGDLIRVFSGARNTEIRVNGLAPVTLPDKGGMQGRGWYEILEESRRNLEFISDKPIHVVQYNNGQSYDGIPTDPFNLVLTPVEQYQTALIFCTPRTDYPQNFVNLVMDSSGWNDIEIAPGGTENWQKLATLTAAIPKNFPTLINGVRYAGVSFEIAAGTYRMRGRKPFAGYIYGWSTHDSYGYPLSVALGNLSVDDPDAPMIEPEQDCQGNVEIATTDMPDDANRRTNLSTIELDPASYNFSFNPRPVFIPGEDRSTTFKPKVDDLSSDAMAIIVISDGRGNTSRDTFYYSAFDVRMTEDPTDFGSMNASAGPTERTLLLRNWASQPVTINQTMLKFGNRGFTVVDPVGEFTLGGAGAPDDSKAIVVRFTPTASGIFEDSIGAQAECGPRMLALLKASVGTPRIQVEDIDFGEWSVEAPALQRTFVIRNTSTDGGVLIIEGVALPAGPFDRLVFSAPTDYPVFPLRLAAGEESAPITVFFNPEDPIHYRDSILFNHNAGPGAGSDSVLLLNGTGTATTGVVEAGLVPGLSLGPIAPTPTDGRGTLGFTIPGRSTVEIIVVDATGRPVGTLLEKTVMEEGAHTLRFDLSVLPAGSYFCRMIVGEKLLVHPLVVR